MLCIITITSIYNRKESKMNKKKIKLTFLLILLTMFIYSISYSDEILLKNGKNLTGSIIDETVDSVNLKIINGPMLQIKRADIKEIKKTTTDKIEIINAVPLSVTDKLMFRLGLYGGLTLPLAELSSSLDIGGGANILFDLRLPLKNKSLNLRPGIRVGFTYMGGVPSIGTGTFVMLMPILLAFEFSYDFYAGPVIIKPIFAIIGGGALTMGQRPPSELQTEFNAAAGGTAGVGLQILSIRKIEFFITADYLLIFNTPILGHFLNINLGVAYRFDGTWGDKDEKNKKQ